MEGLRSLSLTKGRGTVRLPRSTLSVGILLASVMFGSAACPTLLTRDGGVQRDGRPTAPGFQLVAHNGQPVSLETLVRSGPVVVAFYRGHW